MADPLLCSVGVLQVPASAIDIEHFILLHIYGQPSSYRAATVETTV